MKLSEITQAIKLWDDSRKDIDLMQSIFDQGNAFKFNYVKNAATNPPDIFVNAYLGVIDNNGSKELKLFLINSNKDTKEQHESPEGLLPCITVIAPLSAHDVLPMGKNDVVDPEQARQRIQKWSTGRDGWIRHQIEDPKKNIHQIFEIPTRYLKEKDENGEKREYQAYFALNKKISIPNNDISEYKGDMIILDLNAKKIILPVEGDYDNYYNTVRLVPPLHREGKDTNKFYLLKLSTNIF